MGDLLAVVIGVFWGAFVIDHAVAVGVLEEQVDLLEGVAVRQGLFAAGDGTGEEGGKLGMGEQAGDAGADVAQLLQSEEMTVAVADGGESIVYALGGEGREHLQSVVERGAKEDRGVVALFVLLLGGFLLIAVVVERGGVGFGLRLGGRRGGRDRGDGACIHLFHAKDIEDGLLLFAQDCQSDDGAGGGDVEEVEAVFVGGGLLAVEGVGVTGVDVFAPFGAIKDPLDAQIVSVVEEQGGCVGARAGESVEEDHVVKLQPLGAVDRHDLCAMHGVGSDMDIRGGKLLQKCSHIVEGTRKLQQAQDIGVVIKVAKFPHQPIGHLQGGHEGGVAFDLHIRERRTDPREHRLRIDGGTPIEILHHRDKRRDLEVGLERVGGFESGGDAGVCESFGEGVAVGVGVDEEGHIVPVDAVRMEVLGSIHGGLDGIVLFGEGLDMDVPLDRIPLCVTEPVGRLGGVPVDRLFKPPVDLLDDMGAGAVVGRHGLDGDPVSGGDLIKQLLDPAPEAVEGLFGVPDVKERAQLTLPLPGEDLIDQRLEEEKLERGGVLKLIEEDVVKPRIKPKVEKLPIDACIQEPIGEIREIIKSQHPPKFRLGDPGIAVVVVEDEEIVQYAGFPELYPFG